MQPNKYKKSKTWDDMAGCTFRTIKSARLSNHRTRCLIPIRHSHRRFYLEPVTWGFIGTIVGTVAGASASILTTVIAERNRRSIRRDEANYAREERAREFQCENLLKVQDVLSSTMRLIAKAHLEDMQHYSNRQSESDPAMLSEDLDNEILLSNRELSILSERIADDLLRENIKFLRAKMTAVLVAKSAAESESALEALSYVFDESMARIGIVLRNTF